MSDEVVPQLLEGYITDEQLKESLARYHGGKRPSDRSFRRWRQQRNFPAMIRVGRLIMYKLDDVLT